MVTATDIYRDGLRDGLRDGIEQSRAETNVHAVLAGMCIKLCKMLPDNIDLDCPNASDFKDNSGAFIEAMRFAKQILAEIPTC
jgi:hypothetical protein